MKEQKPLPTFKIESLIDKEGEYVGIFCSKTGQLIRHEGRLAEANKEQQEEISIQIEIKDINQISLF